MQQTASFIQGNGKWRVVIVDKGQALGSWTAEGWRAGARARGFGSWQPQDVLLVTGT